MLSSITIWLKKYGVYILLFIGLLVMSFVFGKCSTYKERSQQIANLAASRDSINESIIIINGLKNSVSTRDAIILTKDEAIKVGLLEQERLKKLHLKEIVTNTELQGQIRMLKDSLKLQPGTTIISIKDTNGISRDYMRMPFKLLDEKSKWLTLDAGVTENRHAWYSLEVPISGVMTIGYQKTGFLKTKPVGIFTSENPYLAINQMDITIIQEKQKWFNKTWVHMVVSVAVFEGARILLTK